MAGNQITSDSCLRTCVPTINNTSASGRDENRINSQLSDHHPSCNHARSRPPYTRLCPNPISETKATRGEMDWILFNTLRAGTLSRLIARTSLSSKFSIAREPSELRPGLSSSPPPRGVETRGVRIHVCNFSARTGIRCGQQRP